MSLCIAVSAFALPLHSPAEGQTTDEGGQGERDRSRASSSASAIDDVITVTGTRRQTAVDRRSYDISTRADATTITAREAIERLPGVVVNIDGELSILGQDDIIFLVDGQFFPRELAMQIPASQIERVEIITNPGADSQGDGATVNLILKKEFSSPESLTLTARADSRERFRLTGDYSLNNDDWQILAFANGISDITRRSDRADLIYRTPEQRGETGSELEDTVIDERRADFLGLVTRKLGEGRKVTGGIGGEVTRYDFRNDRRFVRRRGDMVLVDRDEQSTFDADFDTLTFVGAFSREIEIDNNYNVSISVNLTDGRRVQFDEFRTDDVVQRFERTAQRDRGSYAFSATRQKKFASDKEIKLGFDVNYQGEDEDFSEIGDVVDRGILLGSYEREIFSSSLYGSYSFPIGEFTVLPGARVETLGAALVSDGVSLSEDPSFTRFLPSLHLARRIGAFGTLKASVAQKAITPNWAAFDPVRRRTEFDTFTQGDNRLNIGTSLNFEMSHEMNIGKFSVLTTLYRRKTEDDIDLFFDFIGQDLFLTRYVNIDANFETGGNVNIQQKLGDKFQHTIDLSLFRVEQDWVVDERDFSTDLSSYSAKYNLEFKPSKKHTFLLIVQQEGPSLVLNAVDSKRLSSTAKYVRTFASGLVLTVEGIDLLATNERTTRFENDTLERFTARQRQERGLRATLSRRF